MKKLLFVLSFLLLVKQLTFPSFAAAEADSQLLLSVGEMKIQKVHQVRDIVVGNSAVIEAQLIDEQHLAIRGVSDGFSQLVLIDERGNQQQHVVSVESLTSPSLQAALAEIESREAGLQINKENAFTLVSGVVSDAVGQQLQELSGKYPELLLQTVTDVPEGPMIELAVKILEVKEQAVEQLGLRWGASANGPMFSRVGRRFLDFPFELASQIQLLEREGHARLLAEPVLTSQAGAPASFLAGGEIPIPQVVGQGLQDVTFREYGIRLNMTPELVKHGAIKTTLTAEVSSIDGAVSVNGIPGILTRKTQSVLVTDSGETMVISGLLNEESSATVNRLPWLAEIPVLGRLFKSSDYQQQRSELLVLVTPRLAIEGQQAADAVIELAKRQQMFRRAVQCVGMQE